jgi:rhodanese-related sulfurtransferase
MSSINSISTDKLYRLIGTPSCPLVVDVRTDEDVANDPSLIPGSLQRSHDTLQTWAPQLPHASTVIVCREGLKLGPGVAAWLRAKGIAAEVLEGGHVAWRNATLPCVPIKKLPPRDDEGRTVWVTRERPKIDRIACPWLIRRFVDPTAVFLFVAPTDVVSVGERFGATPFDIEGAYWSHRGEQCSFDVMVEEFGLATAPLLRLAALVRGADTARLDLAPEAAGLLAASLGLSRMYADDLAQLDAGIPLYDAFYRWARDATGETHNWPTNKPGKPV